MRRRAARWRPVERSLEAGGHPNVDLALAAGCDDYHAKPVDFSQLLKQIAEEMGDAYTNTRKLQHGGEVRFSADVYEARSGELLGSAQAQGSPDSVLALFIVHSQREEIQRLR